MADLVFIAVSPGGECVGQREEERGSDFSF